MFQPDQKVICIDNNPSELNNKPYVSKLETGKVYTVRFTMPFGWIHGKKVYFDALTVQELSTAIKGAGEALWEARRFRALDDPAINVFKEMLTKDLPEDEKQQLSREYEE